MHVVLLPVAAAPALGGHAVSAGPLRPELASIWQRARSQGVSVNLEVTDRTTAAYSAATKCIQVPTDTSRQQARELLRTIAEANLHRHGCQLARTSSIDRWHEFERRCWFRAYNMAESLRVQFDQAALGQQLEQVAERRATLERAARAVGHPSWWIAAQILPMVAGQSGPLPLYLPRHQLLRWLAPPRADRPIPVPPHSADRARTLLESALASATQPFAPIAVGHTLTLTGRESLATAIGIISRALVGGTMHAASLVVSHRTGAAGERHYTLTIRNPAPLGWCHLATPGDPAYQQRYTVVTLEADPATAATSAAWVAWLTSWLPGYQGTMTDATRSQAVCGQH